MSKNDLGKFLVLALSSLLLGGSIWFFGHRQLGGFDMSALVDTGWRMATHQKPYHDFVLTTPVSFYIGAGWALRLFGVKWSAFVLAAIIIAIPAFLLQVYLLNRIIPWRYSFAIALVCQMLCSVVISYWWYNSLAMTAACLFLSAAYVFASQPKLLSSSIALWGTLLFLSTTKPNIAGSVAIVILVIFLFTSYRWRVLVIYAAGLVSFLLILFILQINVFDVIKSYAEMAQGRGIPSIHWFFNDKYKEHLVTIPFLVLSVVLILAKIGGIKHFRQAIKGLGTHFSITIAVFLLGIFSMLTNSDSNFIVGLPFFILSATVFSLLLHCDVADWGLFGNWSLWAVLISLLMIILGCLMQDNIPLDLLKVWYLGLIVTGIISLFLFLGGGYSWSFEKLMGVFLLLSAIVAMYVGMMRWRVRYIGPGAFFTKASLVEVRNIPFFENFWIAPNAKQMVREIQDVLTQRYGERENWRNAPIYFGARIEFMYAAFYIQSPKNLPIWWHPGNSYNPADTQYLVESFLAHNFETCIFFGHGQPDYGFLPPAVIENLIADYERLDYENIVVYFRK